MMSALSKISLSAEQLRAVMSNDRALVITAGPGSGKTEVVARRIERLLQESEEEGYRVLALSYTVKAADELRERLSVRLGGLHRRVDADTVHGFALSLLRQYGTRIGLPLEPEILATDADRTELFNSWLSQSGQVLPESPGQVFADLDKARAKCEDIPLLTEWRAALDATGALDYAAMLDRASELADDQWIRRQLRKLYEHIVIDEAQNLTPLQYRFISKIVGPSSGDHIHAMLVGDESQSIVGFAGAEPRLISEFADQYRATRIGLDINFRSAQKIVDVSKRIGEQLGLPKAPGPEVHFSAQGSVTIEETSSEQEEADFVARWTSAVLTNGLSPAIIPAGEDTTVRPEEVAVLARASAGLRLVRAALTRREIKSASGSTPDDWVTSATAKAVIDIIAHKGAPNHVSTRRRLAKISGVQASDWHDLRTLLESSPDPSISTLSNLVELSDIDILISRLQSLPVSDDNWLGDLEVLMESWQTFVDLTNVAGRTPSNFYQHILRCQRGDSLDPGVRLLTIHKAQGREFRAVAIVGMNEGQLPDFRATTHQDILAELRTMYVATTRASRVLLFTRARSRMTRFGVRSTERSSFLRFV